jgi:hypothetical protein
MAGVAIPNDQRTSTEPADCVGNRQSEADAAGIPDESR